jgi:hypothetical protein
MNLIDFLYGELMANQLARKTKLMRSIEEKFQRPLEKLVPELVNQHGLSHAAGEMGVSTATLSYWMLKLGIRYRRVALTAQETIEVKRPG